jgi:periplasmic protein TonB
MKTKIESLDDIVFECRNKAYGAYELRRNYSKRGFIAILIAFVIVFLVVGIPLIANIFSKNFPSEYHFTTIDLISINLVKDDIIIEIPEPPAPAIDKNAFTFKPPVIVDDISNPGNEFYSIDDLSNSINSGSVDTASGNLVIVISDVKTELIHSDPVEVIHVQEKPVFPGGEKELLRYISSNIVYPELALEHEIEGTVYIRFVVTKTGEIGQTQVVRNIDPQLEAEALRIVKGMPRWTPGKNNGHPVSVWFMIPVKFKILKNK